MGVGDSVGEGVGVRSFVGSIVGVFVAVGISDAVGVSVRISTDADDGELDICLELQALIPKSKIMKNIPILFISLLELLIAAQWWGHVLRRF